MDILAQVVTHILWVKLIHGYPFKTTQNEGNYLRYLHFRYLIFIGDDVVLSNSSIGAMKHTSCTCWWGIWKFTKATNLKCFAKNEGWFWINRKRDTLSQNGLKKRRCFDSWEFKSVCFYIIYIYICISLYLGFVGDLFYCGKSNSNFWFAT